MFKVEIAPTAAKNLRKLNAKDRKRITKASDYLAADPFKGSPLKGEFKGLYRIKIPPFRLIYKFNKKQNLVSVILIDYRQGIYKKLGL